MLFLLSDFSDEEEEERTKSSSGESSPVDELSVVTFDDEAELTFTPF